MTGYAKSGKGEVAKWFARELDFKEMNFADPLKDAVALMFGWPREKLDDQEFKATPCPVYGITPRVALQQLGTNCMRIHFGALPGWKVSQDFWIERMRQNLLQTRQNGNQDVIISDVRFANEANLIRELGGIVLRVHRKQVVPALEGLHESERIENIPVDEVIPNHGTLEDLWHTLNYGGIIPLAIHDGEWVKDPLYGR